ncbi:MAG: hypothetical protein PVG53_03535 [Holophagae bacterium]|jgi:hypothetical protein
MNLLAEIDLLTDDECDRVHHAVHELEERWIRRRAGIPFFTLGAAAYLDATQDRFDSYVERARIENPVLEQSFGWLHDRLLDAVADIVAAPCTTHPRLALPGFHVFFGHPSFARPVASKHFDLQYEAIDWSGIGAPDPARQLSITLAIRVPSGGAALKVWNVSWDDVRDADRETRRRLAAANRQASDHPYRPGVVAVHSGHLLHQIAPFVEPKPDDERLTMQAHALPVDDGDRWIVYW